MDEFFIREAEEKLIAQKKKAKLNEQKKIRETEKNSVKEITTPSIPNQLSHFGYLRDEKNFYILEIEDNDTTTVIIFLNKARPWLL